MAIKKDLELQAGLAQTPLHAVRNDLSARPEGSILQPIFQAQVVADRFNSGLLRAVAYDRDSRNYRRAEVTGVLNLVNADNVRAQTAQVGDQSLNLAKCLGFDWHFQLLLQRRPEDAPKQGREASIPLVAG